MMYIISMTSLSYYKVKLSNQDLHNYIGNLSLYSGGHIFQSFIVVQINCYYGQIQVLLISDVCLISVVVAFSKCSVESFACSHFQHMLMA